MDELKARWKQLEQPGKLAIIVATVAIGLIVILKILPVLVAAIGIGFLLVILFVPYWIPTIIAFRRNHPSKGGILVLNFFSGWTVAGWVVSLVWALSDNTVSIGQPTVVINTNTTVSPTMSAVAGTPPPPQHQVGDVVNGHRFDGASWIPHTPPAPPELPSSPAVGSDHAGA